MNEFAQFQSECMAESTETLGQETITINGASFACDITLDPVTPTLEFGGEKLVQMLRVLLPKAIYPTEPAARLTVIHNARAFTVRSVLGHNANDPAWMIEAMRLVRPSET